MTYLHYVYAHIRNDTGQIFYVGKGYGNRLRKLSSRNGHWRNVVAKAGGFKASVVAGGLTENEAFNFEKLLIQQLRMQTDVTLTNLNEGGKGGSKPSEETIAKLRLVNLGRKHTPEFCENQRANMIGYSPSPTTREKVRAALKGRKKSADHVAKVAKSLLGKKHSNEAKAKMSAARKGMPPANKGTKWSEATREKIAAIWAERRKNGTNTRVISDSHKAAMKAAWVVRKQKRIKYDLS